MSNPLPCQTEWTLPLLKRYDKAIGHVAHDFGLDTYSNQIEIINAEHMIDAYAANGMPLNYNHWSFGKLFVDTQRRYLEGNIGLAYEIVINADPCITYLLDSNSLVMQATVIAHASYGHNAFFKGNHLFTSWTTPDHILDYLLFAKQYIAKMEQRHGIGAVEEVVDACHSLLRYGVDRHDHEDNLLYFIEKNSPILTPWQREIVRIVRKIGQYFYPQRQTKLFNEGWATFWHYTLLNALYDQGQLTDEFMMEFVKIHTDVITQPDFGNEIYTGINPYALGFKLLQDIKRICETPTEEDKQWFPDLANTHWQKALDFAMRNFNDEGLVNQYLSPNLIRDFHLFCLVDDEQEKDLYISAIHNESGYELIRRALAYQYSLNNTEPTITIDHVNTEGNRSLTLNYQQSYRRPLAEESRDALRQLYFLWGFPIHLNVINPDGETIDTLSCPLTNPS